ncbi:MAG: hypothetical protein JSS00_13890 [Proteobacteria bacterium]|nr:hypothetical protein [Pseudomonadota bacterium]
MSNQTTRPLEEFRTPTSVTLALLWTSLMFLYIYNDYFSLYMPHTIEGMMAGRVGPLGPATEPVMIGVSMMLAVPALMIVLSVALPPTLSRWLNVLMGLVYTAIEVMTFSEPHSFYKIVVGLEIVLTLWIVWRALRWPRKPT